MNLAVDIGNTHIKAAVFEDGQLVETFKSRQGDSPFFEQIFRAYPGIDKAILSSVRGEMNQVESIVSGHVAQFLKFDNNTPIPIANKYKTPETLGADRLAASVGAHTIYPDENVLVFDFGTAITIDAVTKDGEFLGGNISPGMDTRFKALNEYTSVLPLVEAGDKEETRLIAGDTTEAIRSGVINGILYEIEGYIERMSLEFDELKIIFTGGDGKYFAKRLKNTIFATYDLVVYGLNRILEHNADL